jgi:curved DNA-binding protein CbpA
VRIPLDYYRILGLPIQATNDQIKQAHRDRSQQLPRREYSEVAIFGRKQLIDEAYQVLSSPGDRQVYDAGFLAKTYEPEAKKGDAKIEENLATDTEANYPNSVAEELGLQKPLPAIDTSAEVDPHTPFIEITDPEFVGALLILQELGEYELILKLTRPYLINHCASLKDGKFGDPALVVSDVILTVALAYLELGREQWQQGQYENAAGSLEHGQELLLKEQLFTQLRGEMQGDLYKLRPYRIMELLALPEEQANRRRHGMQLLQDMLQERGGIEGQGDDQSGLGIEDFLQFVQQLRVHLTTSEQKSLFEAEARRPSGVATYLAVYTLLAQGFAQTQPALIRKAKLMLMQLGRSQDVHLEKALCSLLLGQTEEANRSLELSQEYEPLEFIRQHSQSSPDMLPGLCLYAEHWLTEEVFPHFRDLTNKKATLKDYFANPQVQSYLEALPTEAEAANQWVVVPPNRPNISAKADHLRTENIADNSHIQNTANNSANPVSSSNLSEAVTQMLAARGIITSKNDLEIDNQSGDVTGQAVTAVNTAQEVNNTTTETAVNTTPDIPLSNRRRSHRERKNISSAVEARLRGETVASNVGANSEEESSAVISKQGGAVHHGKSHTNLPRLILLLLGLLGIGLLIWLLTSWVAQAMKNFGGPKLAGEQAMVQLDTPPLPIPEPPKVSVAAPEELNNEVAALVIKKWFDTKAVALGPDNNVEKLSEILIDPALNRWQNTARNLKQDNSYRKYVHDLQVNEVKVNENNPEQAQVEVEVKERTEFFTDNRLLNSQQDDLRIRYELVLQNNEWRIRDWQVLGRL